MSHRRECEGERAYETQLGLLDCQLKTCSCVRNKAVSLLYDKRCSKGLQQRSKIADCTNIIFVHSFDVWCTFRVHIYKVCFMFSTERFLSWRVLRTYNQVWPWLIRLDDQLQTFQTLCNLWQMLSRNWVCPQRMHRTHPQFHPFHSWYCCPLRGLTLFRSFLPLRKCVDIKMWASCAEANLFKPKVKPQSPTIPTSQQQFTFPVRDKEESRATAVA